MRDIEDYSKNYSLKNFEDYQVKYRRKKILETIEKYRPRRILEIGCGMEPLFKYFDSYDTFTIVEPSKVFYENVIDQMEDDHRIVCYNEYFTATEKHISANYDMIICASLLHEIEDVDTFINDIRLICNKSTIVHINVPNANSFHRELAKEMGIIQEKNELTERNIKFQQNRVFDFETLEKILIKHCLSTIESGTLFIKPFTHEQMYKLIKGGIIDEHILNGLYKLSEVEQYKNLGSEIWCNIKLSKAT